MGRITDENFDTLYAFIMDNIRHSYSSLTTFENCKYCYKLSYIDKKTRINNFFAEYGLLTHKCIEEYFSRNLDSYELVGFFRENYMSSVVSPPPPFPAGMEENYIQQGEDFFSSFYFPLEEYEVVGVEDELKFEIAGLEMTGRPDLILKEKVTEETILLDYKTSKPFRYNKKKGTQTEDKPKMDGYFRQMYLYCYALKQSKDIQIDKITLWFTRVNQEVSRNWNETEEQQAVDWAKDVIERIKVEREFAYDNSNSYFCNFLCGVREDCQYREIIQ